jgi:hypothetical protein
MEITRLYLLVFGRFALPNIVCSKNIFKQYLPTGF